MCLVVIAHKRAYIRSMPQQRVLYIILHTSLRYIVHTVRHKYFLVAAYVYTTRDTFWFDLARWEADFCPRMYQSYPLLCILTLGEICLAVMSFCCEL